MFKLVIILMSGFHLGISEYPFKITDCSPKGANMMRFSSYSISPYPPKIPGKVTVNFKGQLLRDMPTALQLRISLKRHVLIDIPIPCISDIGSCTYNDVCSMLNTQLLQCPPQMKQNNFPCHCPFQNGTYSLDHSVFVVPKVPSSLSWLLSGDYKLHVEIRNQNNTNELLSCFDVQLSLTDGGCSGFLCSIFG